MHIESVLIYVENQLAALRFAPPPPAILAPLLAAVSTTSLSSAAAPSSLPLAVALTTPLCPVFPQITLSPLVSIFIAFSLFSTPFLNLETPSILEEPFTSEHSQASRVKIVKILDPPKFFASAEDKISYEDWHQQMLSKISINKSIMLMKASKQGYILSRVADKALAQLKLCLRADANEAFWQS